MGWVYRGMTQNFRSGPALWQSPGSPPEVGQARGPAPPGLTRCPQAGREPCLALVQGEQGFEGGGPRSSSLGVESRWGGTSAPSLLSAEASMPRGRAGGAQASGPFWARSLAGFPLRNSPTYKPYCGEVGKQAVSRETWGRQSGGEWQGPREPASPVQIIEEGEQVEGEFAPGLLLAVVEDVRVHDGDCVIHGLRAVGRAVEVPGGDGSVE